MSHQPIPEEDPILPPDSNTDTSTTKPTTAPKWLQALGLQSWQAELLLSGLVITGLFQFPDYLINWLQGCILVSTPIGYTFYHTITMILLAASDCLILLFGIHLVLRSIWIALIGLHSVYPDGIKTEHEDPAKALIYQNAQKKYPDLGAYIIELDQRTSLIFSIASVLIIILCSLSIFVWIFYSIFSILNSFFPILEDYIVLIGIGLYIGFSIFAITIGLLRKKYPDNDRLKTIEEHFGDVTSVVLSLYFLQKPVNYITSILGSRITSNRAGIIFMIFCGFLGFQGATQTQDNPIYDYMGEEDYITFNNDKERLLNYNYNNLRNKQYPIFTPLIPSDIIEGSHLQLFIPIIEREKEAAQVYSRSFWERISNNGPDRATVRKENLVKYAAFNQIFVNDQAYSNLEFNYFIHPNAGEWGLLVYLPTTDFKTGRNILEIRKNYYGQDSTQKIVHIPFQFVPQK